MRSDSYYKFLVFYCWHIHLLKGAARSDPSLKVGNLYKHGFSVEKLLILPEPEFSWLLPCWQEQSQLHPSFAFSSHSPD